MYLPFVIMLSIVVIGSVHPRPDRRHYYRPSIYRRPYQYQQYFNKWRSQVGESSSEESSSEESSSEESSSEEACSEGSSESAGSEDELTIELEIDEESEGSEGSSTIELEIDEESEGSEEPPVDRYDFYSQRSSFKAKKVTWSSKTIGWQQITTDRGFPQFIYSNCSLTQKI
ncbi:hypothetical protein HOLleu_22109 [Holothuria leucospilota]|uniref:Uncharacterized protein n=1 Tax=Holothuria leucospilota TaxID=206669 RepID=A0A9Q1BYF3_HOLLE|nr:hypothetical protein HOLleu_22109 [Holothuria leucospilota]